MTQSAQDIIAPIARKAVANKLVTLSDIAQSPAELVERTRRHPQANQLLQEYCKQIIERNPGNRATQLIAEGVITALRANLTYQCAYRYHFQKDKPENAHITLKDFKQTFHMAVVAAHTGNSPIYDGYSVSHEQLEIIKNEAQCDNARWIGTHCIAISVIDLLVNKLGSQIEHDQKDMPKGYSSLYSLLKIRTRNLLKDSRKRMDETSQHELFKQYPFAHDEWMEADISGLACCESLIYDTFHKSIATTHKALTIAMQKQREPIPHVKAYIYMLLHIVRDVMDHAFKLEQEAKSIFDKDPKVMFHKSWRGVIEAVQDLRNRVAGRNLTITGEWATGAMTMCEKMSEDITQNLPMRIIRNADMQIIMQYADITIATLANRLRSGKGLPLSWVIALRKIMGNKADFRKLIGQLRNSGKLNDLPSDDVIDAGEHIAKLIGKVQKVKLEEPEDMVSDDATPAPSTVPCAATVPCASPQGIATPDPDMQRILVQEPDEKVLNKSFGNIVLLRYYIIANAKGKPDYLPHDDRERRKNWLTALIYGDGGTLTYTHMAQTEAVFGSKADLTRALREIGLMGERTRKALAKLKVSDLHRESSLHCVDRFRKNGYQIPQGYERIFMQELSVLTSPDAQ